MTIHARLGGLSLAAVLMLPAAALAGHPATAPLTSGQVAMDLIARGGGGRSGGGAIRGGGGGSRSGGGRSGGDRMRPQTGFQNAGSGLNRGDRRPSGGWSSGVPASSARPSLDRPSAANRPATREAGRMPGRDAAGGLSRPADRSPGSGVNRASGGRDLNRADLSRDNLNRTDVNRGDLNRGDLNRNLNRDVNRDFNRNVNRNWNRTVNIGDVDIHPGWARPGWGIARPWNYGWYGGWSNPPWGWWGARAAVWGIGTLATASMINSAVDAAINDQVSYIVVPDTSYQLLYGSVVPSGSASVSFAVTADGSTYQLTADCQAGTINGQDPASAAEAELLNAACQVAYGST